MSMPGVQPSRTDDGLSSLLAARSLEQIYSALSAHNGGIDARKLSKLAIVGAAGEGQRLARICRDRGIDVVALVDDDPSKAGKSIGGATVRPVAALSKIDRSVPVVVASHRLFKVVERLRALGFRSVMPFATFQILAPEIFAAHMFYEGLLDELWEDRDRYVWLNKELADDRSREVLNAVLAFRQTLDPATLKSVLDEDDLYAPRGLFQFADRETYVDGGSYDGDTIRTFIDRVRSRFERVYAFEPDPKTFAALTANFASEPRVRPINAGLHSKKGELRFRHDSSRGAIFVDDGDISIPVTTIDEEVGDSHVTFIKMNIEGAEIDALYGAEKTIRRCLPKLAISVYHRASDLWKIPLLVRGFSDQYDLYLRQHDGGIIETVLYAIHRSGRA